MISVRKALPHPQVLSTTRHVLQGWVDLKDVRWDADTRSLHGTALVTGGEPFRISIAGNGAKALTVQATGGQAKLEPHPAEGLSRLVLSADENAGVTWTLKYE